MAFRLLSITPERKPQRGWQNPTQGVFVWWQGEAAKADYSVIEHQSQFGTPMEQAVVSSIPALTNIKITKRMAAPMIKLTGVG